MKRVQRISCLSAWILVLAFVSFLTGSVGAQSSDVLGEVQFEGMTKGTRTLPRQLFSSSPAGANANHSCDHGQGRYRADARRR
jgi:hypothetical protein